MYVKDTILALKEPRDPDPETGEKFPYNRVRVVGQSPISHEIQGDWRGVDAEGVILEGLTNFGATLDEPFGKCVKLYTVESIPEAIEVAAPTIKVIEPGQAGPTPEEVFAEQAPGTPPEPGQKRGRSPRPSPLGEERNEVADGPLGRVEAPAPAEVADPSPLADRPVEVEAPIQPVDPVETPAPPKSPLDD